MQPSSDQTTGSTPALRKWGPLAAIVVVIAVIAGIVVLGGGDDDGGGNGDEVADPTQGDDGGPPPATEPPEGAISWTRAQEEGLDVTFPDTCDTEVGRVALPYYFAPECYADADPVTTPGTRGVTDETVKVVVYLSQDSDPVLNFITEAIGADDDNDDAMATYRGLTEIFNEHMQTYGRQVELEFLVASGLVIDEAAARADAVRAVEEMGAFAVWGGPALANAWTDEIKARGAICLACPSIDAPDPTVLTVTASADQTRAHLVEYVSKKLAGKPAIHAGDEAFQETERVFGHLWVDPGTQEASDGAEKAAAGLASEGIELAVQIGYDLNPGTIQEQAGSMVSRLKAAGVTTVLMGPTMDPVAPKSLTEEATRQDYFPEWVLGGSALVDATAFGRTYDQQQWANAFGISSLAARTLPEVSAPYRLYDWYFGRTPEAEDTIPILWPQPGLFFAGLQAAGPDLTPETFRDGLFSVNVLGQAITQPTISFGEREIWDDVDEVHDVDVPDYYGIDDFTEIWWDPDASGPDEIQRDGDGMYQYVDGGRRYMPGTWTDELRVFEPDGAVPLYEEIPAGERPRDYPSPR